MMSRKLADSVTPSTAASHRRARKGALKSDSGRFARKSSRSGTTSGPSGIRWIEGRCSVCGAGRTGWWSSLSTPTMHVWFASSQSWSSEPTQKRGSTGLPTRASSASARRTTVSALYTL